MQFDYARFMVVYQLYSYQGQCRLRVKVPVHENDLSHSIRYRIVARCKLVGA